MSIIGEFRLPTFQKDKGEDWGPFLSIIQTEELYLKQKTLELYKKRNISTMQFPYINHELEQWKIQYKETDSIGTKKRLRRDLNRRLAQKGDADIYLDIQESIVGTRGQFYSFSDFQNISDKYVLNNHLFLDIKTNDPVKVARILELFRDKELRPAFYQIYLVYFNGSIWEFLDALTTVDYFFIVDGNGNFIIDENGHSIIVQ